MSAAYFNLASGNFLQDWSNTGLITGNNWDNVPSIIGFVTGDVTSLTGVDPRTIVTDTGFAASVIANQAATATTGGVLEIDQGIANPTVAFQGSNAADYQALVVHLNAAGRKTISISANLRDLDASADASTQQVALQYRVGVSGNWTNLSYVADASAAGATLVTPITAVLPVAAEDQGQIQIRFLTTNAAGNDELIGVDDIAVTSEAIGGGGGPGAFSIADASVTEGNSGAQLMNFTVTRPNGSSGAVSVDYGFNLPGGASGADASDFATTPVAGTLEFGENETSKTIVVQVQSDTSVEANETFTVTLANAQGGATIGDGSAIGTIINDDVQPVQTVKISEIQGTAFFSPILAGEGVSAFNQASATQVTVSCVVTALDLFAGSDGITGFYICEEQADWDADSRTSEGIFVRTNLTAGIQIGETVTLTAQVMEFQGFTNLNKTMLVNATNIIQGNVIGAVPTLVLDGTAGKRIPNAITSDDNPVFTDAFDDPADTFDPENDALDFYETIEGMHVTLPQMVVGDGFVGGSNDNFVFFNAYSKVHADPALLNVRGGYTISGDPQFYPVDTAATSDDVIRGGRHLTDGAFHPDMIELDFGNAGRGGTSSFDQLLTMGDEIGDVTGVIDFDFGVVKLYVQEAIDTSNLAGSPVREETALIHEERSLRVATFNVENLTPVGQPFDDRGGLQLTTQAKLDKLAADIATNLKSPDIIIIEEVQDNNGINKTGTADASQTWDQLVAAVNLATGFTYSWVDETPDYDAAGQPNGDVGGAPGGNQRVGFLYRTDQVSLGGLDANATIAERRQYTDRIGDGVRTSGDLIAVDDSMLGSEIVTSDWSGTRRSIVGEFVYNGNTVYVVGSHLPSKGGSGEPFQINQNIDAGAPANGDWASRNTLANDLYALQNYVTTNLGDAHVVSGGDFNEFWFYRPMEVLTGYATVDGVARVGGERFSNLMVDKLPPAERFSYDFDGRSQALDSIIADQDLAAVAEFDAVHINTGYNDRNGGNSPASSDHDPSLARFDFRGFSETLANKAAGEAIDGGGGVDSFVYTEARDALTILSNMSGGWTVRSSPGVEDMLSNVEQIETASGGTILLVGNGGYATIQAAVDAARDGDEIIIAAGTYTEQVTISGRANLNIHSGGGQVIVRAPADLAVNGLSQSGADTNVRAVIAVNGSTEIDIWGIEIDGAFAGDTSSGSNGDELAGLAYLRSSGDVFSITVQNVGNSVAGGLFGLQHGVGIIVDGTGLAARPRFDLQDSSIGNFQKTGVHVIGAELYYFDNRIDGIGATGLTAQNGIQVQGSTGTIIDAAIRNLGYTGPDVYASGIIAFRNDALEINAINFEGAAGGAGQFAAIDLSGIDLGETVTIANNSFGTPANTVDYGVVAYGYQDGAIQDVLEGQVALSGNSFNGVEINGVYYDPELFASPTNIAQNAAGSSVADVLFGSAGGDTLTGLEGNDQLNGRGGIDTAVFAGARSGYSVTNNGQTVTDIDISNGDTGTDSVTDVEFYQFADQTVAASTFQKYTLQLLHLADGEAGTLAPDTVPFMAALIDKFEDSFANSITLAGGDTWLPGPFLAAGTDASITPVLNALTGSTIVGNPQPAQVDVAIHNLMGVQASTIGNHEFDLGSNVFLSSFAPGAGWVGAAFPYLSSNIEWAPAGQPADPINARYTNTVAQAGLEEASTLKGRTAPSAVITENGEKIGLVGVTTQLIEQISSPSGAEVKGFPFGPGANGEADNMALLAAQLQPVIDDLRNQGVNKIVLMAHLQVLANEKALAPLLEGVDIILAAGSNTRLGDDDDQAVAFPGHAADFADTYPIVTQGKDGKTTVIVNTDNEYTYLGRLVVDFDNAGDIILDSLTANKPINGAYASTATNVAEAWNTNVGNLEATAFADGTRGDKVRDLTNAVDAVITAKDGTIYGYTDVYLEGERSQVRSQETNLGNLSADANADVARDALGINGQTTAVVSIKNGGGIRAQIGTISAPDPVTGLVQKLPPEVGGEVSQLDVENALRFDNRLMVFDTTPQGLLNILNSNNATNAGNGGFIQLGGVRFSYDPTRALGQRVRDIALTNEIGQIVAMIADNGVLLAGAPETISVVALNFTANGGDGYNVKPNADNFRFLLNDGTVSAPVNESLNFTAADVVPSNAMGEQQALADYLQEKHATPGTAFDQADTPITLDERIQNLGVRADTALDGVYRITAAKNDNLRRGTDGDDKILTAAGNDTVSGAGGDDTLNGGSGDDILDGGSGNDALLGGAGIDRLFGGIGDDALNGLAGNDLLFGGDGLDKLTGGNGADKFMFLAVSDSLVAAADQILDFDRSEGDLIDLSAIDSNTTLNGDQAFNFIGQTSFTGVAGELAISKSGNKYFVIGDVDGNAVADFSIQVRGLTNFTVSDFVI